MFQFNVPIVNACLWMRDDHAHVMQVKLCKANTRGVTGCLSERQLRKLEKMRQDGKTPLYRNCPMSKLAVKWVFEPAVMSKSKVVELSPAIAALSCSEGQQLRGVAGDLKH